MVQTVAEIAQTNVVNIQVGLCSIFTSTCPETLYFSLTGSESLQQLQWVIIMLSLSLCPIFIFSFILLLVVFVSVAFAQYLVATVPILDFVLVTHSPLLLLMHYLVIVIMSHSRPLSLLLPFPPQSLHYFSLRPLYFLHLKAREE